MVSESESQPDEKEKTELESPVLQFVSNHMGSDTAVCGGGGGN